MLLRWACVVVAAYATIVLLMWLMQDRLVYFPRPPGASTATPAALRLPYEDLRILTADGETLAAWWVPAAQQRGVVLLLHGNAGSIADRIDYLPHFSALGQSVLLVDYRGYGASSGKPSEAGTYADAQAAWHWLTAERGFKSADITVVGESLGGAVAAELAARVQPQALLLISTFTSLQDLGAELYPWLPVRMISRYRYETLQNLKRFRGAALIAHSRDDDIIPFAHGRRLHAAAANATFLELRGGHNSTFLFQRPEQVRAVGDFLQQLAVSRR